MREFYITLAVRLVIITLALIVVVWFIKCTGVEK